MSREVAATPRTETYSYDGALRLTGAARPEGNAEATGGAFTSRTYGYDGRGRRVMTRIPSFAMDVPSANA